MTFNSLLCAPTNHWRKSSFRQTTGCWMVNRGNFALGRGLQLRQVNQRYFYHSEMFYSWSVLSRAPSHICFLSLHTRGGGPVGNVRKGEIPPPMLEWMVMLLEPLVLSHYAHIAVFFLSTVWLMGRKNTSWLWSDSLPLFRLVSMENLWYGKDSHQYPYFTGRKVKHIKLS